MDFKFLDCCLIQDVVVHGEPNHVFEYEKSANELAEKVNGEIVRIFQTSYIHLWHISYDDCKFIGYGVLDNNNELI